MKPIREPSSINLHHATSPDYDALHKEYIRGWDAGNRVGRGSAQERIDALVARVAELEAALYEIANGGLLPLTGDDLHDAYHTIEALKQLARSALARGRE